MKTTQTTKETKQAVKAVNAFLEALTRNTYFNGLPLDVMFSKLVAHGFTVDENNLLGVYCGREGRVHEPVGLGVFFTMTYYKMESGRYEVVAYVS